MAESLGEQLSVGERRRSEIARSLIPAPRFMLFDEPFAGVDPINVGDLQRQIARLKERGLGVLITDHNVQDTLRIVDRAYLISASGSACTTDGARAGGHERGRSARREVPVTRCLTPRGWHLGSRYEVSDASRVLRGV